MKNPLNSGKKMQCFFLLAIFFLTSCATTIKFPVQRPAEIDSKGATSIAVIPFSYGNTLHFFYFHDSDSELVASYIQEKIQNKLSQSDFFTQVSSNVALAALKSGQKPPCDLYITGAVYNLSNNLYKEIIKVDEEKNNEKKKVEKVVYGRQARVSINYQVVYATTGEVLYSTTQHIEESSSQYERKWDVPSFFSLVEYDLNSKIQNLTKKLMPYTTTRKISLLKDKSKDSFIEEQMKAAEQIAKDGNYSLAQAKFMEIYERERIFEAGYNAARLLEVMGQLEDAAHLMSQLYFNTNNSKAQKALKEIQQEIWYQEQFQRQIDAQKRKESY